MLYMCAAQIGFCGELFDLCVTLPYTDFLPPTLPINIVIKVNVPFCCYIPFFRRGVCVYHFIPSLLAIPSILACLLRWLKFHAVSLPNFHVWGTQSMRCFGQYTPCTLVIFSWYLENPRVTGALRGQRYFSYREKEAKRAFSDQYITWHRLTKNVKLFVLERFFFCFCFSGVLVNLRLREYCF